MCFCVSVKNILHHFTVGPDATRVAIVTYSTAANVDVNYVTHADEHVTKCDIYRRISEALENIEPGNHAATGNALHRVYELLLDSRASTKKAVVLITDGRLSNFKSITIIINIIII